jgi:two-component system copper resistance phosphate regulon response regulator CusR
MSKEGEPMRILVVDDDASFSQLLRDGLSAKGFHVDLAFNGKEALQKAIGITYDIILLDVLLPEIDGYTVLKKLRAMECAAAVLMVSFKDQEGDKLRGFASGADDYLVKPVRINELIARIRAILRRIGETRLMQDDPFLFKAGPLVLDLLRHEARKNGKPISMTKTEYSLLECLIRRPGQVIRRPILAKQLVSGDIEATANVIDVHIKNLRCKIDGRAEKSLIRTIRGVGYLLDTD